jgi:hypothetical protein
MTAEDFQLRDGMRICFCPGEAAIKHFLRPLVFGWLRRIRVSPTRFNKEEKNEETSCQL